MTLRLLILKVEIRGRYSRSYEDVKYTIVAEI
jgi:hypothetical protein